MFPWRELRIFVSPRTYLYIAQIYPLAWMASTRQWDENAIREFQRRKLVELIQHAIYHTDYYSEIARENNLTSADVQSVDDLSKFPTLHKDDIRGNWRKLCSVSAINGPVRAANTSGTTGVPLTTYVSRRSIDIWTSVTHIRAFQSMRLGYAQRILWLSQFRTEALLAYHTGFHLYLFRQLANLLETPSLLGKISPAVIVGHPYDLRKLAQRIRHEELKLSLKAIISTYDLLDPTTRRDLQQVFDCDIYEFYAMTETSCDVAWECPAHQGFHINADYIVVEVLDPNRDRPVGFGEIGEVTITDLHSYIMPLIRYRTGDLARLISATCPCGRRLPRVARIEGRVNGSIITPGGNIITTFQVMEQLGPLGIGEVEVVQESSHAVTVKYVQESVDGNTLSILQMRLRKLVGHDFSFTWSPVNRLDRSPTGKFLTVRSRIPATLGVQRR